MVAADVQQRLLDVDSSHAMVNAARMRSGVRPKRGAWWPIGFAAGVATSTDVLVAQVALLEAELRARARLRA